MTVNEGGERDCWSTKDFIFKKGINQSHISIVLVTSLFGCLYDFHVKSTFYDTGGESFKFIVHIERPRFYCGEVCQGSGPG